LLLPTFGLGKGEAIQCVDLDFVGLSGTAIC
jgi:hypothetical protein